MDMRRRKASHLTLEILASAAGRLRNKKPVGEDPEFSVGQGELEVSLRHVKRDTAHEVGCRGLHFRREAEWTQTNADHQ